MNPVIFVTIEDISKTGGSGVATRELIRAIGTVSEKPLYVICPEPEGELPARLEQTVHEFRFLPCRSNPGAPIWHLKMELLFLKQLGKVFHQENPVLIVTRMSSSTLFPVLLSRLFNVPHVLLIRGWINRHDEHGDTKFASLVEQLVRMNVSHSDEVYVAFDELREWVNQYRTTAQSSIKVLPNAVDPNLFTPRPMAEAREAIGLDDSTFVVGFVGSLAERHELPTLLQAITEHESIHVLIVGDGNIRTQLERTVEEYNIRDRVTFTGRVNHEDVPKYIAACDVTYGIVSPGRASNPIKCYEYLACQRPVITSRTPELSFVNEINAGVALDAEDTETIEQALLEMESLTRNERQGMGKRGREYVVQNNTWSGIAQQIISH